MEKQKNKKTYEIQKRYSKMAGINLTLPNILNVNRVNFLVKGQRWEEYIRRHYHTICCLQEIQFRFKSINREKVQE